MNKKVNKKLKINHLKNLKINLLIIKTKKVKEYRQTP